jgi:hypothetical protein
MIVEQRYDLNTLLAAALHMLAAHRFQLQQYVPAQPTDIDVVFYLHSHFVGNGAFGMEAPTPETLLLMARKRTDGASMLSDENVARVGGRFTPSQLVYHLGLALQDQLRP